jgi:hypothetical protein
MGSFGKTKWQMAYALLDHPDLGDRRPSAMMAEMLALRFETTPPDSLFLALFLRRLPASILDHLAAANHGTATAMATHADVLWDARNSTSVSAVSESLAAVSVRSASPRDSRSPDRRARSPDRRHGGGRQPFRRPTPGCQESRASSAGDGLCRNQKRYGAKAYNCRGNCTFAENKVAAVGSSMLSAASSFFRIRFPNSNFWSTQVPPYQSFHTGLQQPLQVRFCPAQLASPFQHGGRLLKNSLLVSTPSWSRSFSPQCPSQSWESIFCLLTACWLILFQKPCCSHHPYNQSVAPSPLPLQGLPRQFCTLFRRSAPSLRSFPALSAMAKALRGPAMASAILLKQQAGRCLPRPAPGSE